MKKIAVLSATIAAALSAHGADKITYDEHVLPVFRNACLNCHNPDKKKAGLDLSTYQAALQGSENGKVLQSGNAAASLLFKCVKGTEEPKMPPKGDMLTEAELAIVEKWIAGQLLENATGKAIAVANNNVAVAVVSLERPAGPPPMPGDLPLEPYVRTRATNALTALAVSPWAPVVAVGGQKQVLLYNTETLAPLGVLPFPEGFPSIIRFSRNGQLLLTGGGLGGKSGKVVLWDIKTGERIATIGNEFDQVLGADISADQQFIALGGPTKLLKIYSTKDGKLVHSIKKHTDWITAVVFSPDGKYLASADRSGGIQIWEGSTGKEFNTLAGHKAMVTGLAFMPGVLASTSEEGKIALWDAKEGKLIRDWAAHAGGAAWVDFTPDGRVVSCGRDKLAKVWDQNGKQIGKTAPMADIALRAVLSSDRLIAGDWTGRIQVTTLDGKPLGELTSNPPSLADRMTATTKLIADTQAVLPSMQQQLTAAESKLKADRIAAEEKRKTELAALQKTQDAARQAMEAAKAQIASAEKNVTDTRSQRETLKAARETAQKAVETARKLTADKNAASAPDVAAAEQDFAAKKTASEEAGRKFDESQPKLAAAEAALQKARAELPKVTAASEKTIAEAKKQVEKLGSTPPGTTIDHARVAALKQRLDNLNAEQARRREARGKTKEGTPEFKKADELLKAITADIPKIQQEYAAAQKPASLFAATEQQISKLRAEITAATAQLASARTDLERWKIAQVFQSSYNARRTLADKEAQYAQLVQVAKDAPQAAEKAKNDLAEAKKTVAEGPAKIQEAEKAFAAVRQAVESSKQAVAAAEKAKPEKDAAAKAAAENAPPTGDVAGLTKKIADQTAEIAKLKTERAALTAGSPEVKASEAKETALKAEIAKTRTALTAASVKNLEAPSVKAAKAEAEKAGEALDAARLALKVAVQKSATTEKALAAIKKTVAQATAIATRLEKELPQIAKNAETQKVQAEQAAAAAAKEVEAAKADAEKRRAEFETLKNGAQKAAALAVPPSKS